MEWLHYVSYFLGGAFLSNAIPHLASGVVGQPFQSPFAKPPGQGLSASTLNVMWGFFNLAVAYVLICLHRPYGNSGVGFSSYRPDVCAPLRSFPRRQLPRGFKCQVPLKAHRDSGRLDPSIWKIGSVAQCSVPFCPNWMPPSSMFLFPALPPRSTAAFRRSSGSRAAIFSRLLSSCL